MKPKITKEEIEKIIENKKTICMIYGAGALGEAMFFAMAQHQFTAIAAASFTIYFTFRLFQESELVRKARDYREHFYGKE